MVGGLIEITAGSAQGGSVGVANVIRGMLVVCVVLLVGVMPAIWYRAVYAHSKRLRVVVPGRVYRSGQMTAEGFADAFARLGIRTVINVQDDFPDPDLDQNFINRSTVRESDWCAGHGVRYVALAPDLISRRLVGANQPKVIDKFLSIMDDEHNYPVLIHCKAGLHRTGVMVAVYRMEYQGWSPLAAIKELKDNGFGEWAGGADNDYIEQYITRFQPGQRRPLTRTVAGF
jgi:tyrosine-protein phosphatase SIW14